MCKINAMFSSKGLWHVAWVNYWADLEVLALEWQVYATMVIWVGGDEWL